VCCVYPRINVLDKPPMQHCEHLRLPGPARFNEAYYTGGNGCENCKLYDERPDVCKAYTCAWLQGHGDEGDRPDRSLMLFDRAHNIGNALSGRPLLEGAADTDEGRAVIDRVSRMAGQPVLVMTFYERRIVRIAGRGV
jgi:hypothetical protein